MPNAKVGDLCIVSGKAVTPGLAGRIVEVVRPFTDPDEQFPVAKGGLPYVNYVVNDRKSWVCKSANMLPQLHNDIQNLCWMEQRVIDDTILIPLRDNDEEDEMIAIAGKPLEVEGSF